MRAPSHKTLAGRLLRLPLRIVPRTAVVRLLQSKARGKKWIAGSSIHRCWIGNYEYRKRRLFEETISEGSVLFDIGAHVGFYTLLASTLVGPRGRVIAFEPLPRNLRYLKRHIALNQLTNVTIIEAAVGEQAGVAYLEEGGDPLGSTARLVADGSGQSRVVTVDGLVGAGEIPAPDFMKLDIEGGELAALLGAREVLRTARPTLFLATHGPKIHYQCCELLRSLGYELAAIEGPSVEETEELLAWSRRLA